jgi:hypothetical protein
LKPGTRKILELSRGRQNKYWVGPKAMMSRAGMAKTLRRERQWAREKKAAQRHDDSAFQRHLERTRGFD